jgi:hypothetical protein
VILGACSKTDDSQELRLNRVDLADRSVGVSKFAPAVFPPEEQSESFGGQCNLEVVDGVAVSSAPAAVSRRSDISLTGWAFNSAEALSPASLSVGLLPAGSKNWKEELMTVSSVKRYARPDVATAVGFKGDSSGLGFEARATIGDLSSGVYDVVIQIKGTKQGYLCATGKQIDLRK